MPDEISPVITAAERSLPLFTNETGSGPIVIYDELIIAKVL